MTDPVQLSIDQFTHAWRLMCGASSKYQSSTAEDVALVFSGLPIAFFNVGLVTGRDLSAAALATAGRRACDWAAAQGVPWLLVTTHEALADAVDAKAALDEVGFAPLMPLTGMIATKVAPAARVPEGLELTTPDDDEACKAITTVNSKAYAMELAAANEIIGRRAFWRDQFPVVALASGSPVACAAAMMVDDHRYVALVATDPAQQRRGYAEAAMRRALADAAAVHGERPTVLHATEAGKPVYERMGFRVIANHTVFMEKRFLTEH
jgi:ribosomal protein S18 acetylase RimI-like enzyme